MSVAGGPARLRAIAIHLLLAMASALASATAAYAQDVPKVISPLQVESDQNGVNLLSGKVAIQVPTLSVPAAPNLIFDRVQNAAPYLKGTLQAGGDEGFGSSSFSVHIGARTSDSFTCANADCTSVKGSGAKFTRSVNLSSVLSHYTEAGSAARWAFNSKYSDAVGGNGVRSVTYYASQVTYPNGEVITYTYDKVAWGTLMLHRPTRIESTLGYFITISYQGNEPGTFEWNAPSSAAIFSTAAPSVPLSRQSYIGASIVDHGARAAGDPEGRTYVCTDCNNGLGSEPESWTGSLQLPGETSPAKQVAMLGATPIVGSVTNDGVVWNYSYANLRYHSTNGYLYDSVTVSGPNGFNAVYAMHVPSIRNAILSITVSPGRTTGYEYEEYGRPWRVTMPEGNKVSVAYDQYGNINSRTVTPKGGGTGITETANFPVDTCATSGDFISCYRPTWVRDALQRQTDFAYNALGQLTVQIDPADNNGVRKRTEIFYTTSPYGKSRRTLVLTCVNGANCATNPVSKTEYDYWGETFLPSAERRIDVAAGVTLQTTYSYDNAGRPTSVDGPLPGTADATYTRYDIYGRKIWEIGPLANGVRQAKRISYRNSDDKPEYTESGTVPDENSTTLSNITRTDLAYDTHRNAVREAVSVGGTVHSLVQRSYDDRGRLDCEAKRMNPAVFASLSASACDLGPQGTGANDFGPDRITRNSYDAAGDLVTIQRAYRITQANGFPANLQQNYAGYEYTLNGKQKAVIDANGNRAELTWDSFDRQRRWIFPSTTTVGVANQADYEEYTYDAVGNRTHLRKRDGVTIVYQYDALNRVVLKTVPTSASGAPGYSVYSGYDVSGLQTYARFGSATGLGITNTFDGFGRLKSSSTNMDGTARTINNQYDAHGNRTQLTVSPSGHSLTYVYDAADLLWQVKETGGLNLVAQLNYDAEGRRSGIALGSAMTAGTLNSSMAYTYDPLGRLSTLSRDLAGLMADQALGFSFNPASQIVTRTSSNDLYASNVAQNVSRDYAKNGLNQYTGTTSNGAPSATFAYDANGNLTSDGSTSFVYDAENRLVSASGARNAALAYDPLGRLWQTSGGSAGTTRFVYDGDRLLEEYDGAGTRLRAYAHGVGADEPLVWYEFIGGAIRRFIHTDNQGSVVLIAAEDGTAIAANGYDSWGIPNAANIGRFQYTGQTWIPELGMYYYKARFYSPTLGRFMQVDPIGYTDEINLYGYVGNDPVNRRDPTGLAGDCNTGSRIKGNGGGCKTAYEADSQTKGKKIKDPTYAAQGRTLTRELINTCRTSSPAYECGMWRDPGPRAMATMRGLATPKGKSALAWATSTALKLGDEQGVWFNDDLQLVERRGGDGARVFFSPVPKGGTVFFHPHIFPMSQGYAPGISVEMDAKLANNANVMIIVWNVEQKAFWWADYRK